MYEEDYIHKQSKYILDSIVILRWHRSNIDHNHPKMENKKTKHMISTQTNILKCELDSIINHKITKKEKKLQKYNSK